MIQFGTKIDIRDGKAYRTVLMPDGKWWLAENLAWGGAGVVYDNNPANEPIYGRMYTWAEALTSCVSGCHVPSDDDWYALQNAIPDPDGRRLKSTTLWTPYTGTDVSTDEYGFRALPGGRRYGGSFQFLAVFGHWWSETEQDATSAWSRQMGAGVDDVGAYAVFKTDSYSVRLIVDDGNIPDGLALSAQPSPGTFSTPQLVTIVSPEGAVVRYTTDGSIPTDSSPIYRGPIRLAAPTLIRAKIEGLDGITDLPFVIQGRPLDAYKQEALFTDGKASPAFITRSQTL